MGSGAGIDLFTEGHADFGASDAGITGEQIDKVGGNVELLPVTAASVVLAYNLPGFPGNLKLSRDAYAGFSSAQSPVGTTRKSPSRIRGQACRS